MARKEKVQRRQYPGRQYLEGLKGYKSSDSWGGRDDSREGLWKEQRLVYGFDERQTWGLDSLIVELIYERLQMLLEISSSEDGFDSHCLRFEERDYTQRELIEELLRLGKIALEDEGAHEPYRASCEFWSLWSESCRAMCW